MILTKPWKSESKLKMRKLDPDNVFVSIDEILKIEMHINPALIALLVGKGIMTPEQYQLPTNLQPTKYNDKYMIHTNAPASC